MPAAHASGLAAALENPEFDLPPGPTCSRLDGADRQLSAEAWRRSANR